MSEHATKQHNNPNNYDCIPSVSFESLGLNKKVLRGIKEAGFTIPSPIQEKAIPPIMEKRDVIAQAQTGTGKTAAFALPILHGLKNDSSIEALIITPTRELAMQISDDVFKLGKFLKTKTICVYGGQSIKKQIDLIERNPQVMIATPGRLLDHLKNERLKNFCPAVVVLDECDEMLDMGFIDDIEEIFKFIPNNVQTLLFSATMPPRIQELAEKILYNPLHIKIASTTTTNEDISQRYYIINENERNDALVRLIDTEYPSKSIVFIRTKKEADEVNTFLQNKGYKSVALHGDMDQRMRRDSITAFKKNKADILVATDVAARGLDISNISHVFNYHIPLNIESYVHRIGRTGRAGNKGVAITLSTPLEYKDLNKIQSGTKSQLKLYEVPGVSDDVVINSIIKSEVSDVALSLYESIRDRLDTTQLALKLLTLHLQKNVKIGLSKQEVEHSIHSKEAYQNEDIAQYDYGIQSRKRGMDKSGNKNARGIQEKPYKRHSKSKLSVNEIKQHRKLQSQQKYYKG
ncbi:DEAD/DEAH box helicase [Helicobacter muridarum]|uniref:Cold-shock DEAD-box protein A n=1 Tax=Helicobacter muridarum TaxID=216 RepID=A0A099TZ25_9HELI|nr:DEAD/DEAH box helicase [Helicobacter muridarum]TLE01182.1 DEAD/DEAH box helicase [Helicobacter muridarum]STQ86058.1 cold-shock DEAD-box protein A [Helicobacter muridarum]